MIRPSHHDFGLILTLIASFIVYKLKGEPTNLREAADLLSQLGEVAKAEYLDEDTQISLGLAQAVVITYKMYDSRREPVRVSLHITWAVMGITS